jgi:hypothetical protein
MVDLHSAVGVYPGVMKAILGSSFYTETDFGVATLFLANVGHQLTICDFLAVCLSVR